MPTYAISFSEGKIFDLKSRDRETSVRLGNFRSQRLRNL